MYQHVAPRSALRNMLLTLRYALLLLPAGPTVYSQFTWQSRHSIFPGLGLQPCWRLRHSTPGAVAFTYDKHVATAHLGEIGSRVWCESFDGMVFIRCYSSTSCPLSPRIRPTKSPTPSLASPAGALNFVDESTLLTAPAAAHRPRNMASLTWVLIYRLGS
jgi:hypothetical protein